MQQTLDITRTSRTIVSQMLAGYTLDQLNTIQKDTVII
jgi:CheY-specific phosphatase CheX